MKQYIVIVVAVIMTAFGISNANAAWGKKKTAPPPAPTATVDVETNATATATIANVSSALPANTATASVTPPPEPSEVTLIFKNTSGKNADLLGDGRYIGEVTDGGLSSVTLTNTAVSARRVLVIADFGTAGMKQLEVTVPAAGTPPDMAKVVRLTPNDLDVQQQSVGKQWGSVGGVRIGTMQQLTGPRQQQVPAGAIAPPANPPTP